MTRCCEDYTFGPYQLLLDTIINCDHNCDVARNAGMCFVKARPRQDLPAAASVQSNLTSATIDEQFDACDKTGIVRGQEHRCLCNFIRLSHASHRDCGQKLRDGF